MHDRERGAAHVPVIVFLLTLILFFGALGFGYVVMEKNNELEGAIRTARAEKQVAESKNFFYDHYVKDLAAEVGEVGKWAGRSNFNYSEYGIDPETDALQNVAVPAQVAQRIGDFARELGVPQVQGISNFMGHVKSTVEASKQRIAALESEQTRLETTIAELQTAVDTVKGERDRDTSQLNTQLAAKDVEWQAEVDRQNALIQQANTAFRQAREEQTVAAEEARKQQKHLNGEIEVLDATLEQVRRKVQLINPPHAADATVLEASQSAARAWVDIGRRDMLPVGTTFRITAPDSDDVKAYGTVVKVERDRAELRVTGLVDRYDPIVPGDEIHNDLYSPNLRRTVYLLGRFGHPYSKPMVRRILEDLGNTVVEEIGPSVDLVLVGQDEISEDGSGLTPITESDAYKQVLRLGIETATLNKVRDFLKLSE